MDTRDADGDFTAAYLSEYRAYMSAGLTERAAAVAAELRARGVDVEVPVVENKFGTEAVETTIPAPPSPSAPAPAGLKAQARAAKSAPKTPTTKAD